MIAADLHEVPSHTAGDVGQGSGSEGHKAAEVAAADGSGHGARAGWLRRRVFGPRLAAVLADDWWLPELGASLGTAVSSWAGRSELRVVQLLSTVAN